MKRNALFLSFLTLGVSSALMAQTTTYSPSQTDAQPTPVRAGDRVKPAQTQPKKVTKPVKPLSRLALGGGVSAMGGNMQAAINLNRYLNVRGTGNYLNYTVENISANGFNVVGKLNMATGGAGIDLYPFPNHGFRLSPGVLFHNDNAVSANVTVANGTKLTLNGQPYYSLPSNPITGTGSLGLNTNKPAFTITTGWGNMIPRKGGHWSFPFEIGAAMIGTPGIKLAIQGTGCIDPTNPLTCVNMATDPTVQSNLTQQIAKYQKDIDPLKYYPILSFGLSYNFKIR